MGKARLMMKPGTIVYCLATNDSVIGGALLRKETFTSQLSKHTPNASMVGALLDGQFYWNRRACMVRGVVSTTGTAVHYSKLFGRFPDEYSNIDSLLKALKTLIRL